MDHLPDRKPLIPSARSVSRSTLQIMMPFGAVFYHWVQRPPRLILQLYESLPCGLMAIRSKPFVSVYSPLPLFLPDDATHRRDAFPSTRTSGLPTLTLHFLQDTFLD